MSFWLPSRANRVVRSGGWGSVPRDTRVAVRDYDGTGSRDSNLSLRLVRRVS